MNFFDAPLTEVKIEFPLNPTDRIKDIISIDEGRYLLVITKEDRYFLVDHNYHVEEVKGVPNNAEAFIHWSRMGHRLS